ncbi:MAG TPA: phage/plasmid primase, P4 family, partial [Ktedonobacterales bacterium]|nr:phage/plasmid primase, P4 family [Ktedonobacterales bacterium]
TEEGAGGIGAADHPAGANHPPETFPHARMQPADLLAFGADDNGNAEAMRVLYGDQFIYSSAFGWLGWTGTHWKAGADAAMVRAAIQTLKCRRSAAVAAQTPGKRNLEDIIRATTPNEHRIRGCTTLFRAYVTEPDADTFDADPDLLNCRNGVLNLQTGTLSQHCPRQRFTYVLPVAYDPEADTAIWHDFIHEATGQDEAVTHFIQQCIGYSLTGHTREEKLFYLYGPLRAGKGCFTETLLALLPRPLGTEADFNTFTAKREADTQSFDMAPLKPARLVIASESNRYQSLNPAKIKHVTGGNLITCAFKHRDMFTYRPQYKVWLVSNHEVNGDPDDDALWGRVLVIRFPRSHLGTEDTSLKHRLRSPEGLQGLLRWAVEGALAWYRQDRLEPPAAVVMETRRQRTAQDYVGQWLSECCVLSACGDDATAWAASAKLMSSYRDWCQSNNIRPVAARELGSTLSKRFGRAPGRHGHEGTRGFCGIAIRAADPPVRTADTADSSIRESPYTRAIWSKTPPVASAVSAVSTASVTGP